MGEQNKILDVTYGKFSCRLEGFDDAVETMKAVVSFFHDLAGHESFMEVAPGMPDLETLAEMAEAQAGGRVTAAPMGNGVSLTRTADEDEAASAEDAYDAFPTVTDVEDSDDAPAAEEETDALMAKDAADPAEDGPVSEEADEDSAAPAENIFEDTARTTEAAEFWDVATDEAAFEANQVEVSNNETAQDDGASFASSDDWLSSDEADATEAEDTAADADVTFDDDTEEAAADDGADPLIMQDEEMQGETAPVAAGDDAVDEPADEEDSFTSKLDRIRAVVSRGVSSARAPVEESSEPPTVRPGNPLAQRLAELAKRNSELIEEDDRSISPLDRVAEGPQDEPVAEDEAPAVFDEVAGTEAEVHDDWASEAGAFAEETSEEEPTREAAEEFETTADTGVEEVEEVHEEPSDVMAEVATETPQEESLATEDDARETEDVRETALEDDVSDDITADSNASEEERDEPQEVAASESDDSTDSVAAEESSADAPEEDDRPRSSPTADRPLLLTTPQRPVSMDVSEDEEEDFDLSAELAEIEKEIAARPRNEMTRHGLPRRVEDAMSRIFMQTNQQLDEPEGRRQRDALAQLKAAVAATEAAKQLGDQQRSRDIGDAYREDLGALSTEGRKGTDGLPPLKLVQPEQDEDVASVPEPRITSKPLDVAAQRLRQIAATKDASDDGEKSEGFVAFLEKQGVSELGDKLEAAAAYLAFVEGEPDFTRPQLMRLVQSASREEITREDGLRCFGRLLRQSRFSKLNNGRFKVDDNTPFRPRSSRVAQG